jgi:hypothetical protein
MGWLKRELFEFLGTECIYDAVVQIERVYGEEKTLGQLVTLGHSNRYR